MSRNYNDNMNRHYDRDYNERNLWNEEGDRNWNMRSDRDERRHDEDRGIFQRMGDAIRDTWNEWTGNDHEEEERRYRSVNRHGDARSDRSRGRIYNSDDYRTQGQRGGYIPEREMGNYLHERMYDYGTGNYGAQGMGDRAYDQDFTHQRRGHNAGSGNIKGGRFYDRNNEPHWNRDRGYDSYTHEHRSSIGNRDDDTYSQRDRYPSNDDRYRGTNDRRYRDDDRTMHGERQFFGNDAYGVGRMGGYDDNFPEDYRYDHWRRGTR